MWKKLPYSLSTMVLAGLVYQAPLWYFIMGMNWVNSPFFDFPISVTSTEYVSYYLLLMTFLLFSIMSLYSKVYLKASRNLNYFDMMFNTFFLSMVLLMMACNLVTSLVSWEWLGVTSFLLMSFYALSIEASKSAFQALLLNKVGDVAILFSAMYVYNLFFTTSNTLSNSLVYLIVDDKPLAFVCMLLMMCAMSKCAQHVFSVWLPDAMEGPTPVSALLHSSTMVTSGYMLFMKYMGFMASNVIFPDLIIFMGMFSYLTGIINSLESEDGKGALAYSTVAQTGSLFSATMLLSAGFMLLGFITHGVYKAASFMVGGLSVSEDNSGQEDEGIENDWVVNPMGSFMGSLVSFMTLALPGTLTHTFKWSLSKAYSEMGFVAIFDMGLLYVLMTMLSSLAAGVLLMGSSQQFSHGNNNYKGPLESTAKIFIYMKPSWEYDQDKPKPTMDMFVLLLMLFSFYMMYETGINLSMQHINMKMMNFS